MKSNPDKFQFIILGNKGSHTLQINDITTLLGIAIDLKWNIRGHIDKIKQKEFYNLYDLRRFAKLLTSRIQDTSKFHDRVSLTIAHWFGCFAKNQIYKRLRKYNIKSCKSYTKFTWLHKMAFWPLVIN